MKAALVLVFIATVSAVSSRGQASPVTFPNANAPNLVKLDSNSLSVTENGRQLYFLAWNYNGDKSVQARGTEICKFFGYKTYIPTSSRRRVVAQESLTVIIPSHTNACVGSTYCSGWENSWQEGKPPLGSNYKRGIDGDNNEGFFAPFEVFDKITCDN